MSDNSLRRLLEQNYDAEATRSTQQYDGPLAELPAWVPENFRTEFAATRNRLLRLGHSTEELKSFIAEYADYRHRLSENLNEPPDYNPSTPFDIHGEIETLVWLLETVEKGEKDGLAILIGGLHADQISMGGSYSKHQSDIAKKPRNRIAVDGKAFSATSIVEQLALQTDALGDYLPTKDIWNELYAKFDRLGLSPQETTKNKNPVSIEYVGSDDGRRLSIKYLSFKAMVSRLRRKKS